MSFPPVSNTSPKPVYIVNHELGAFSPTSDTEPKPVYVVKEDALGDFPEMSDTSPKPVYIVNVEEADGPTPEPTEGWQRPADWLPLPDFSEEEGFVGLCAVWPDGGNFMAFTVAGAYTVDWGDGTTPENFSSGATAYRVLDYDDYDDLTTRGYRQAIIKVTPQGAGTITSINLAVKHNQSGLVDNYSTGWLDLTVNGPNLTGLTMGSSGNNVRHRLVEQTTILSLGSVINLTSLFHFCSRLQSVPLFDTAGVTNMSNMFTGCASLQSVPLFDTAGVTTMNNMFNSCASLQSVPLFDTSTVTNMSSMFTGCASLQSVPLFDTSIVTAVGAMFSSCFSISSIPAFDLSAVSSATTNFFNACPSISRVQATGINLTVSFTNCKLSGDALDEIYTNLSADGAGKTITVTGNYGTATHTKSIAEAKGWTVTDT
jgi:surface protein